MDPEQKLKQNNPFAGYNTVAYVPPRGEAPEASLQPQAVSNGSLNQKPLETPENGLKTQNGENCGEKSSKKWLVAVAIVAVLAVIGGVVAWFLLNKQPASEQGAIGADDELVELDINDELVQELYSNFRTFSGIQGFGFRVFYEAINDSERRNYAMVNQAILNTEPLSECRREYSEYGMERCYDVDAVKKKMLEMFGTDAIDNNTEISVFGTCGDYSVYNLETNELVVPTGCGGSGPAKLKRWLYRAESDQEHIYIYELAEIWAAEFADELGQDFIRYVHCHTGVRCSNWVLERADGELLDISSDVVLVGEGDDDAVDDSLKEVLFANYADQLDTYKWTFVKNADGNYIFEKIEKVEE